MKEKIAIAIAVMLIGVSVSACTRNVDTGDDGKISSTTSDRLPGDNDDGLKDNSSIFSSSDRNDTSSDRNDMSSDENRVSSFISSTVSEMK